jgi:hypothetical protein
MRGESKPVSGAPAVLTDKKSKMPESATRAPDSREADSWLSDEQLAKCAPAETEGFYSPVPTRMVSNGEYMPIPQTGQQKQVEARVKELTNSAAKKLGISRRKFLATSGGMAACFVAMNEVYGKFFDVEPAEMYEPAASEGHAPPENLFIFDDQTHMVRSSMKQGRSLRAIAQGPGAASFNAGFLSNPFNAPPNVPGVDEFGGVWTPWNPALGQIPNAGDRFHLVEYIRGFFFDSQVTVSILSNANIAVIRDPGSPVPRPPKNVAESLANESLTGQQTGGVRDFVNQISGSTRMLAHGQLYPGVGNLDFMQFQIDSFHPDSWKGYNIATAAKVDTDPNSLFRQWRLDDEAVAYPSYEVIARNKQERKKHPGFFNICVHKGLAPGPPVIPERGFPTDIPKAATDWPQFNFIIYHSCIQPSFWDLQSLKEIHSGVTREGVPDISWTTQFAQLAAPFRNVYAELGTTFASSVITFPTVWAHIIGQLLKYLGDERVVFGSDSLWYGNPQWQIEAFWRFKIPEEISDRWNYPELDREAKRNILGLNSARLYKLPTGRGDDEDEGDEREHEHRRLSDIYKPVPANFESLIPNSLKTLLEFPQSSDNLSKIRNEYLARGSRQLDNTRYGWIRTQL